MAPGRILLALLFDNEEYLKQAEENLRYAQEQGIDRKVWHIRGSNTGNYRNRGFLNTILMLDRPSKAFSESTKDYISRLITMGRCIEHNGNLHIIRGDLSLNFRSKKEEIEEIEEEVTFYDANTIFGPKKRGSPNIIKEKVFVKNHHSELYYQGWDIVKNLQLSHEPIKIDKPDKIIYHP